MKIHCAYSYINFLRILTTLVFIVIIAVCSAVFIFSFEAGAALLTLILPIYVVSMVKLVPLYVKSHLYITQRSHIIVNSGLIFRRLRNIPKISIISTNIRQSVFEKIFRIMSIELVVGSGKVYLHGLSEKDARKIFEERNTR